MGGGAYLTPSPLPGGTMGKDSLRSYFSSCKAFFCGGEGAGSGGGAGRYGGRCRMKPSSTIGGPGWVGEGNSHPLHSEAALGRSRVGLPRLPPPHTHTVSGDPTAQPPPPSSAPSGYSNPRPDGDSLRAPIPHRGLRFRSPPGSLSHPLHARPLPAPQPARLFPRAQRQAEGRVDHDEGPAPRER